jgi:hypothetical protein
MRSSHREQYSAVVDAIKVQPDSEIICLTGIKIFLDRKKGTPNLGVSESTAFQICERNGVKAEPSASSNEILTHN